MWIKPALSTYAPSCVVSVICETRKIREDKSFRTSESELERIHVAETHRKGRNWSSVLYQSFAKPMNLFEWLETTRSKDRRTYVFTPSAIDTLTLSKFWQRIEETGCILQKEYGTEGEPVTVPASPPDIGGGGVTLKTRLSNCHDATYHFTALVAGINAQIVKYRVNGRSFQWCSHNQYTPNDEETIAESIKHEWKVKLYTGENTEIWHRASSERSILWCKFYRDLCDWWVDVEGGPWGSTTAAMSYNYLKSRISEKTILKHSSNAAARLEDDAIIGGRRSTWYFGNIGIEEEWEQFADTAPERSEHGTIDDKAYHNDVRSMYPYLLERMQYPIRLLSTENAPSIGTVAEMLQTNGVIARVLIKTEHPEYPQRTMDGIRFPKGIFTTTLCGPELMSAIGNDEILHVYSAAYYTLGMPFKDACGKLLAMRSKFRESKEYGWEMFVKNLANSMSGKLAQRKYNWVAEPDIVPLTDWGYWHEEDQMYRETVYYRSIAGMTWRRVLAESSIRPMGAAYAYLTAYGRWYMRYLRTACPAGTVLSQDTDGIWTTSEALPCLYSRSPMLCDEMGSLTNNKIAAAARFFAPQQYWHSGKWVLSGSNLLAIHPGKTRIDVLETHSEILTSQTVPRPVLHEKVIDKSLGRLHYDGTIDDNGWIIPPTVYEPDVFASG